MLFSAEDGTWIFLYWSVQPDCCKYYSLLQCVLSLSACACAVVVGECLTFCSSRIHALNHDWVHVRHTQSSLASSPRLSGGNEMCMGSKLHVAVIQGGGYYHTRRSKAPLLPVCTHARLPLYFLTATNNWTLCIWGTLEYSICEENWIEFESVITPTSAYVANSWYAMWLVPLQLLCV